MADTIDDSQRWWRFAKHAFGGFESGDHFVNGLGLDELANLILDYIGPMGI